MGLGQLGSVCSHLGCGFAKLGFANDVMLGDELHHGPVSRFPPLPVLTSLAVENMLILKSAEKGRAGRGAGELIRGLVTREAWFPSLGAKPSSGLSAPSYCVFLSGLCSLQPSSPLCLRKLSKKYTSCTLKGCVDTGDSNNVY